jgi:hypothetical protein
MECQFSGNPKKIIEAAMKTVGLGDAAIFLEEMLDDPSISEWVSLCSLLHLSLDSISYGYSRREHKARIRAAWEEGELRFPRRPAMKALLSEIRMDHRRDCRIRDQHYGLRLRWKVRWQDLKTELRRLPRRLKSEAQMRLLVLVSTPLRYGNETFETSMAPVLHLIKQCATSESRNFVGEA